MTKSQRFPEKSGTIESKAESLQGHFLVALPGFQSEDFQETVIFICEHNRSGALGLVINQPVRGIHLSDLKAHDLLANDTIDISNLEKTPIFWGGPTRMDQGLIVHSPDVVWQNSISINDHVVLTNYWSNSEESSDKDSVILPKHYRVMLGHVSWKPGQLEKEWMKSAWLSLPYRTDFLFDIAPEHQWDFLVSSCGVHPISLSPIQGRA
jgi:putative transcriptional regulator